MATPQKTTHTYELMAHTYELVEVIGRGSSGTVYKAEDAKKNTVAIKQVEARGSSIFNEIQALRSIDHPGVMRFKGYFQDDSHGYIVSELCGTELYEHIVAAEFLEEARSRQLFRQMLSTIAFIHSNGFIHRDIKPENWCLSGDQLKLVDFGLCCRLPGDQYITSKCGSMAYMAPEVLRQQYRGGSCDVWSLGILLCVMLVGFPPFYGDTDEETERQIMNAEVDYFSQDWAGISRSAVDLVRRLLVKDPEHRINAAEALQHPWFAEESKGVAETELHYAPSSSVGCSRCVHSAQDLQSLDEDTFKISCKRKQIWQGTPTTPDSSPQKKRCPFSASARACDRNSRPFGCAP